MTVPEEVAAVMDDSDAFTRDEAGFHLETTTLETTVTASALSGETFGFRVTVVTPTLTASVADGQVGETVEESWLETFDLRIADAFHVARTDEHDPPQVSREGETVWVELTFESTDADRGVADARALAAFVEGTYLEGLIPGYDYEGPAARLLERAHQRGNMPDG